MNRQPIDHFPPQIEDELSVPDLAIPHNLNVTRLLETDERAAQQTPGFVATIQPYFHAGLNE
jgi:hypothetical protein